VHLIPAGQQFGWSAKNTGQQFGRSAFYYQNSLLSLSQK